MSPAKGKALCWLLVSMLYRHVLPAVQEVFLQRLLTESCHVHHFSLSCVSRAMLESVHVTRKPLPASSCAPPAYLAMARPTLLPAVAVLAGVYSLARRLFQHPRYACTGCNWKTQHDAACVHL